MDINSLISKKIEQQPLFPKKNWGIFAWILFFLMLLFFHHHAESKHSAPPPVVVAKKVASIQKINQHLLTADFTDVPIVEVLSELARFTQQNIVISPSLHGKVSLHWQAVERSQALDAFIQAEQLRQWQVNHVRYVVTYAEWLQHQEEAVRLQKMLDEQASLVTRVWQIQYAKAADIAEVLQDNHHSLLSKRGQIRIDSRTNMLCIQDTASHLQELHRLIQRFDVPVQQVMIEARLANVDSDYERNLGIQWNAAAEHAGLYDFTLFTLASGASLNAQLVALESQGHAELISSPSLLTANQQTASIESGEEIPYQETNVSGASSVTFKKAVLRLQVTPQIMPGRNILLQLQVNQDKPSSRMVLGVPAIDTQQMTTHILTPSGKTIVLGGIFAVHQERAQKGIPFIHKIPLVGKLFGQQNVISRKRELLIFVTPRIIQ